MIYQGTAISVKPLQDGIVELHFDLQGESVNKFNRTTVDELFAAAQAVRADSSVKGMIVTSGKAVFIVGADITEFTELFKLPEAEIAGWSMKSNLAFNAIEDLPFPTVTAINGVALGGGLEMCLSTDFRVMSTKAEVGLPEVKLGLFPGFGGTVRLPRVAGIEKAVEWISSGAQQKAPKALKDGVVDAVVEPEQLRDAALALVKDCIAGKVDYKARRQAKLEPVATPLAEADKLFEASLTAVKQQVGPNYPAPVAALEVMREHAGMQRPQAIEVEAKGFAKVAKTSAATAMVGNFLNDQVLKKSVGKWAKQAKPINRAAVLGAGIMGGGISYQSASSGIPVVMKDIAEKALDLGMSEAKKILSKSLERGKINAEKMAAILSAITPTLNYDGFGEVDIVVEAVVEKLNIKQVVLADVEKQLKPDAFLASNTSTISITKLAQSLQRPENFVGMHFFNPVHMMQLVEVIRGEKSSDAAIAATVAYAKKMGKAPVVVNDCPGFLVNRVLFPYFGAFGMLLRDGADFQKVDKVMEKFGWPMGPAYLMDVVGIDTGVHAAAVMAEGFPERMNYGFKDATQVMFENNRFGQKNGVGFYKYEVDSKGKPKKVVDPTTYELIEPHVAAAKEFDDQTIIDRLMIPMCLEMVRCLEENIVSTLADADMSVILGIGFPNFRGGAIRYIDSIGVKAFVELCDKYKDLGAVYHPTAKMREMAAKGESFYP